jgi:hypothetical protein
MRGRGFHGSPLTTAVAGVVRRAGTGARAEAAGAVRAAVAMMLATALAIAAAGCGGGDAKENAPPPKGRDLTAVECPMEKSGAGYKPADNAFDTAELVGMRLRAARTKAAGHDCEIIVAMKDGRGRPVPIEIDPTRIYVFVEKGVVTYIEGVGGGI